MSKKRRSFSREFKLEAVGLVTEGGLSVAQAARDLGIGESVLSRWKKQFEEDPEQAFPGKGRMHPKDEELHHLRRELAIARQERDILKNTMLAIRHKMEVTDQTISKEDQHGRIQSIKNTTFHNWF